MNRVKSIAIKREENERKTVEVKLTLELTEKNLDRMLADSQSDVGDLVKMLVWSTSN